MDINKKCLQKVKDMVNNDTYYNIDVIVSDNGATIIDAGINKEGSLDAALITTEITLGCLAHASYTYSTIDDILLPAISVYTSHPRVAIFGCQYGWIIKEFDFYAIVSGPIRLLTKQPEDIFSLVKYTESAQVTVAVVQSDKLPNTQFLSYLAKMAKIDISNLFVIVAPANSLVGSIQIAARAIENTLLKMNLLGYNIDSVMRIMGITPIPCTSKNAILTPDDMIIYGSYVSLWVKSNNKDLRELAKSIPAFNAKQYGMLFQDVLKKADYDFRKIDKSIFAPAKISLIDVDCGEIFVSGDFNARILKKGIHFI